MTSEPDLLELNKQVTAAIFTAEHCPDGSKEAVAAFREVSRIEEAIARRTKAEELEGMVARQGAVTAALSAGDWLQALTLIDVYINESAPSDLIDALTALREEAERELSKLTLPDVHPIEFHLAAA